MPRKPTGWVTARMPAYGLGDRVVLTVERPHPIGPASGPGTVVGIDLVRTSNLRLRVWLGDWGEAIQCGEADVRPLSAVEQLAELAGQVRPPLAPEHHPSLARAPPEHHPSLARAPPEPHPSLARAPPEPRPSTARSPRGPPEHRPFLPLISNARLS